MGSEKTNFGEDVSIGISACHQDLMSEYRSRVRMLLNSGRFEDAKALLHARCEKSPGDAQAWFLLGAVYGEQEAFDECARYSRKAVSIDPGHINALLNLAQAQIRLGRPHKAIATYRSVLELSPDNAVALKNLGKALSGTGQTHAAIAFYKAAIAIRPELIVAQAELVRLLGIEKRYDEALACCDVALRNSPDDAVMLVSRGIVRAILGQVQEARTDFLRAIELAPGYAAARSAMLMNMNYTCNDPEEIFSAHKEWDSAFAAPLGSHVPHRNNRDPNRRLRIGYVSHTFYSHSVAFFFEPLLASHDANAVETFCYAQWERSDAVSVRLRAHAHHWRDIRGMEPARVADLVRRDAMDILVDLGGHTAPNLLLVFARKPAPIQVAWLGYPNTTGMKAMDYRLSDEWADPAGITDAYHTETLVRLDDRFLCYRPPVEAPPVSPSPATQTGRVTFGSFNVLQKMTPDVLTVWARILASVPNSRLMLKRSPFRYAEVAARYRQPFLDAGVEPDRVVLLEETPSTKEHLALYSQVDVGLDTFPYNGTTTTCEALWMGVPVVTLAGKMHAGRVGVSILTQLGLSDLIAGSPEDYVRIAVTLANNPNRLTELRGTLRHRMASSPLCDGKSFARVVEDAYRTMWRNWCDV